MPEDAKRFSDGRLETSPFEIVPTSIDEIVTKLRLNPPHPDLGQQSAVGGRGSVAPLDAELRHSRAQLLDLSPRISAARAGLALPFAGFHD